MRIAYRIGVGYSPANLPDQMAVKIQVAEIKNKTFYNHIWLLQNLNLKRT